MAVTRSKTRALSKDRLSSLSDDLLLTHILPKISYRDIVRSSSLSRRWRLLWRKITTLKFDPKDFEKQNDDKICAIIKNALLRLDARLDCLEINVAQDCPKAANLNNWIRLAAKKQVSRMDLTNLYRDRKRVAGASKMVKIGNSIFRCQNLSSLSLSFVRFPKIPANNGKALRNLKTLNCFLIPNMDDIIEGFTDLCPNLRNLSISGGFGCKRLQISSSSLMYLSVGCMSPTFSLQIACPMLTEIRLMDIEEYIGLKLLQGISTGESVKRIILQNDNPSNALSPGIPIITVLDKFVALEELVINGLCFQEMISDEISVAEVKLPSLKMVQAHIGVDKGAQALNFLGFILKSSPLSVTRVFLPECCPDIVQNKLLSLQMEFSKSRLTAVPKKMVNELGINLRIL